MTFSIRVGHNGLDGLERDLQELPTRSVQDSRKLIRRAGIVGNTLARDYARVSSGRHGKLYPRSFSHEESSFVGFGGASFTTTYGPDAAFPQGGMSFENGSRNQRPHRDLARSADIMGPSLAQEVRSMIDGWFW